MPHLINEKIIYKRPNLSSKLFLLQELCGAKLDEDSDLILDINELLELRDKLKSIGEELNDLYISFLVLCSLTKIYEM